MEGGYGEDGAESELREDQDHDFVVKAWTYSRIQASSHVPSAALE